MRSKEKSPIDKTIQKPAVNPTLRIQKAEQGFLLRWQDHSTGRRKRKIASSEELLALKIIAEDISVKKAAQAGKVPEYEIERVLDRAAGRGIILLPESRITREKDIFNPDGTTPAQDLSADTFTLQWHITNVCDLNCKHCYDRSARSPLTLRSGKRVLRELKRFCRSKHVKGHVCFTGGNPFLYPSFLDLYGEAVKNGFSTSILGNPVTRKKIEQVLFLQKPGYYQVSLEGLEPHTDYIRRKCPTE